MFFTMKRNNRYEYVIPIKNTPLETYTILELKEIIRGFIQDDIDSYACNIIQELTDDITTQIKLDKEALIKDLKQIKKWRVI